ncbi:Vacuolar protein sorting-associated protein 8, partial [Characodon lateralis]|nr:Vacuolar protein sorting-associated protein 8 [Characodon lateralis]
KRRPLDQNPTVHGSVLRLSLLKGISAQIVAATDKVDAGLPTAITMSGVIAVGTSHGLALVFDTNQALRLCLGSKTTGAEFGAVSALSINHDCSRLLCGFAKGQITMWDLANGKLLRTITDAHPPGTAILHVKLLLGEPKEFPGQPRDIEPPACPGPSHGHPPGLLLVGRAWNTSRGRCPGGIRYIYVEEQQLYSELL